MASAIMYATRTISGNQPAMRRIGELSAQTFKSGVPVMIDNATGFLKEWDGVTIAIAGVTKEFGNNLTTSATAQQITQGSVPYQSSAANIQRPFFDPDGKCEIEVSSDDTVFFGEVGPAQTTAASDVGKSYGMTKDTDGHWFVDKNKTGASAVCNVVKLDDNDTTRGVQFVFLRVAQQLAA